MSSIKLISFIIGLLLTSLFARIESAQCVDLHYHLIIDNPNSHQAKVRMTVRNVHQDIFEVMERGFIQGLGIDAFDLTARDSYGNSLVVDFQPDPVEDCCWGDSWRIHCTGLSEFVIEYTTKPKKSGEKYYSYVSNEFAVFLSEYIFIHPLDSTILDLLTVSFQVPEGWKVITSWPKQDGTYYPLNVPPSAYPLKLFGMGAIALGHFETHTKRIDTADVTVAVYDKWPSALRYELISKTHDIFAYMAQVWGTSINAPYLFAFCPYAPDGNEIFGGMTNLGRIVSFPNPAIPYGYWTWANIAGETFDARWTGYDWGVVDGECVWLRSAINTFYGHKTCLHTRNCTPGEAESMIQFAYDVYYNNYLAVGKNWPLDSPESDADYFYGFVRGALVLYLLDKEIYQKTNGSKSIDDLLRQLFAKYGFIGGVEETKLKSELALLTGSDFTQFFNDYVSGTEAIPIEWYLQDDDGDGSSNSMEILWDTDWRKWDTKISLLSPTDGQVFDSSTLITKYQPSFSWTESGAITTCTILYSTSSTDFSTPIARGSVSGTIHNWAPPIFIWKKLMSASNNSGIIRDIYWKVIGTLPNRSTVESEVWRFRIDLPQVAAINSPADDAILPPDMLPTFAWQSNANVKFKLEISSLDDFSDPKKIKGFSYTTRDPNVETILIKALPSFQWTAVKKLVGTGTGYFRIKAWDGINRETISEVRTFTIQ